MVVEVVTVGSCHSYRGGVISLTRGGVSCCVQVQLREVRSVVGSFHGYEKNRRNSFSLNCCVVKFLFEETEMEGL